MSVSGAPALATAAAPRAPAVSPPHVMVVGAGFGGLEAARRLARLPVQVTLVDQHNFHTFTPLLYQVATAGLGPEEIGHPVRSILRGIGNVRFRVADVQRIDLDQRTLHTNEGLLRYDYLILAAGSTNNFFGVPGIEGCVFGLKDVEEALALRNHVLSCFEAAAWERDPVRRVDLLTFVIVGGGPTGIEFSGALRELIDLVLPHDYPGLDFGEVRVILLEATPHVLGAFHPTLQQAALDALERRRVVVRLNTAVERLQGEELTLHGGEKLRAATVMWAAGVRAGDLAGQTGAEQGKGGRLRVEPSLRLPGHPEVYVVGDMAGATDRSGAALAMLAPVAVQGARAAVTNIARAMLGQEPLPFRYRNKGIMATIGRKEAVVEIGRLRLTGNIAWVGWLTLHILELIGFRNRLLVLVDWAWNYFTYDRAARLILGNPERRRRVPPDR